MKKEKVVLAFSGGLDTSFCVKYLSEEKGYEVHTAIANTGGFSPAELKVIEQKALALGAASHVTLDIEQEYYEKSIKYMVFGNILRNGTYPISVSSERIFQAIAIIEYAKKIGADYVAHGSTGAGVKPSATTHFSWRTDNISVYKAFTHQHLSEIGRTLGAMQGGAAPEINFVPMRGDFARGILASVYTDCDLRQEEAEALYRDFYADAAFTFVADRPIDLKQAVNTNKAVVQVAKYGRKLHIVSVIDNLLKGASGQAVQNMNLLFGLDEREGLRLKASAF